MMGWVMASPELAEDEVVKHGVAVFGLLPCGEFSEPFVVGCYMVAMVGGGHGKPRLSFMIQDMVEEVNSYLLRF
jgi:hypothetical protein